MASTPAGPARGMGALEAQSWVLGAALITGMVYAFRKIIEPVTPSSSTKSSGIQELLGNGPAPSLEKWAVSYGTAFIMLAIIAMFSPETAGSLAILIVVATLLANGNAIAKDINSLEGNKT